MEDCNRREFLGCLGSCMGAFSVASLGWFGCTRLWANVEDEVKWTREVDFYDRRDDGAVACRVCPHRCILNDGQTGICRSRVNVGGKHYSRGYGRPCIVRVDPVEKIPMSHFLPGTDTMTIACGGCNLRCLYCQNWEQSQREPDRQKSFNLSPEAAVVEARKRGVNVIAFNYTEPVAFLEYATEVAWFARRAEMRVIAATAGYIERDALLSLTKYVDAITVGLKGFDEGFYSAVCGVRLDKVLETIATIRKETKCWLELVNLVVPTYNDFPEDIRKMAGWIRREAGVDTPLHFARYVPMYRLDNLPRTPVTTLDAVCEIARRVGLRYVYTSNIAPHDGNNSYCTKCGASLIQRLGLKIIENRIENGRCPECRIMIPGVWK